MRVTVLIALSLALTATYGAEVFRSVAEDGSVSYADRPLSEKADVVHVAVPSTPADSSAEEPADVEEEASPSKTPQAVASDEMTNEQIAQRIVENCELSRRQLAVVEGTDNLSRTLPDGEMRQLTETEVAEVRARARAEVENWCN